MKTKNLFRPLDAIMDKAIITAVLSHQKSLSCDSCLEENKKKAGRIFFLSASFLHKNSEKCAAAQTLRAFSLLLSKDQLSYAIQHCTKAIFQFVQRAALIG